MKVVSSLIQFKDFGFDVICEVQTEETWKGLTDKLTVKLPKFHFMQDKSKSIEKTLKRSQKMRASLGYDDKLDVVFDGYISAVKPTTPIEIVCEDAMQPLKEKKVAKKSWADPSLKDIFSHIGITEVTSVETIKPGAFMIDDKMGSVTDVLQKLKDDLNIYVFFRKGKLYAGRYDTIYNKATAKTLKFAFGQNIITHSLEYKTKDETKIKIVATTVLKDGKKLQQEAGDPEGQTITIKCANNLSETDLKAVADSELKRKKFTGFRGKFTAFGEPLVTHGDIVQLTDEMDNSKSGSYWVDSVTRKCGTVGYRQEIELGPLAEEK